MAAAPPPLTSSPAALPNQLCFGRFELRPREQRLLNAGEPVVLGGRAYDLLVALVRRPGELLTRQELLEQVWPGRVVEENNLSVQVNTLRKLLGAECLATVPGRGYRFTARVWTPGESAAAQGPAVPAPVSITMPVSPAPVAAPLRTHLPWHQPLLIGRSDDLAALGTLVDQHRLVTIVGAGGMGKTRLAQALLQLRAGSYAQGVCWVALDTVSDPLALPGALATALGVRPAPGDAGAALVQAVAGLQLLVALDNAEHLLEPVAQLAKLLLDTSPGLRLVVTSQAPLKLAAERVLRLGPLALPQGVLPAREAQAFGAVALFAERATAADHRFVLTDTMVPAVTQLCRRLDGLALAIELAAARAPALGVDTLLGALDDRLRLLTSTRDRHAPLRQQTLRAALQWSHALLSPREQRVFRRLAVCPAGASLALVQKVAADAPGSGGDDEVDTWAVIDALDELVQRSLVELELDEEGPAENLAASGDGARYRLLESPRALAREHLHQAGEADAVRGRHARAVRAAWDADEAAMRAGTLGVETWRRSGERELDHARDALAWARAARGESDLALALASALLLRLPAPLHDERAALAGLCESLVAGAADHAGLAGQRRAWSAISMALANQQPARSRQAAHQALALARRLDGERSPHAERWQLYDALCDAADVVVDEDEAAEAELLLAEARTLEDPRWPPVRLRSGLRVQASIAAARGQAAEALHLYRRLLDISTAAGDPSLMTRINLADIELWAGDAHAAVQRGRELVALLSRLRDDNHLTYARINLAAAHLALDQAAAALDLLRTAWPAAVRVHRHAWCCDYLALAAALQGQHATAMQLLGAADARYAAAGDARQVNETTAERRAAAIAEQQLGTPAARRCRERGSSLPDVEIALLAFGQP